MSGEMDPDRAAAEALGETFDGDLDDGPIKSESPESSEPGEPSRSSIRSMLSSTMPAKSPQQASGALDFDTPWYNHAEVALEKATGSDGTPAWVNLVMAFILLIVQEGDLSVPSRGSDSNDDETAEGGLAV